MRSLPVRQVSVAAAVTVCSIMAAPATVAASIRQPLLQSTLLQSSLVFQDWLFETGSTAVKLAKDPAEGTANERWTDGLGDAIAADGVTEPSTEPSSATSSMSTEVIPPASRLWWLLLPLLGMPLLLWLFRGRGDAPLAAAPTEPLPRITFTPRNGKDGYAYWDISAERKQERCQAGGQPLTLRLYDVTDIADINRQMPHSVYEFSVAEDAQDRYVPIPMDNRDYVVELGYPTMDGQWLSLARSASVRVPACAVSEPSTVGSAVAAGAAAKTAIATAAATRSLANPGLNRVGERLKAGSTAVANGFTTAAVASAAIMAKTMGDRQVRVMHDGATSRIILVPRSASDAYAYWEIDPADRAEVKQMGGRHMQLRVYDVTGMDMDATPAHSFQIYDVDELEQDRHVPIWVSDRDYVAEVGYITEEGQWLGIIRSLPSRVSASIA